MESLPRHSRGELALMLLAIAATFAVAIMIVRGSKTRRIPASSISPAADRDQTAVSPGVQATLRLGDTRIERSWPVLDLHLESGQAVDEALPAGPFEGEFMVTFRAGGRRALLGAELQGGSVILMRDDEVLLSDHSPAGELKQTLTRIPAWLPRQHEQIVYVFRADDDGPTTLRAIWQPEGEDQPRPLR